MADGGEIAGAVSGAAGGLNSLMTRNQNKRVAPGFVGQPGYDPEAPFFGGRRGELQKYTSNLLNRGGAVEERSANLANYAQADADRARGLQARQGQLMLADGQRARAMGQVPSIAQMQADRQMSQAQAAQGAQQASARGAAGLALAGQAAAGNLANAQGAISGQAQINAANERMQAEQAAQQAYGNIRGGDMASQNQAANQSQFQAGMRQTNRDANDQRAMGYEQMGLQARLGEMQARTSNQGTLANAYSAANIANQQTADRNAQGKGLIDNIKDAFTLSDERSKLPMLLQGTAPGVLIPGVRSSDNPVSGPAPSAFDKLTVDPSGRVGMDVMGSLQRHSDFATRFADNAGSGPMTSDERTKSPILPMALGAGAGALVAPALGLTTLEGMGAGAGALGIASLLSDERSKMPMLARGRSYDTPLTSDEEQEFAAWKQRHAPRDSGADYDLRGAFRAGLTPDPKTGHWPDTFKKPNHSTFSDESKYADDEPAKAGRWNGEKYTPAKKLGLSRGGRGPRGEGVGDPNAPRMTFDTSRGWTLPGAEDGPSLREAIERQAAQDAEDADINRQVAERVAHEEREAKDPAVGFDRLARVRAARKRAEDLDRALARGGAASAENSDQAPGTDDWNRYGPKETSEIRKTRAGEEYAHHEFAPEVDPGAGHRPWWMQLGGALDAFGKATDTRRPVMVSDQRAKDQAYLQGQIDAHVGTAPSKRFVSDDDAEWMRANDRGAASVRVGSPTEHYAPENVRRQVPAKASIFEPSPVERRPYGGAAPSGRAVERYLEERANDPVAGANRAMQGSAYAYKPGFTPPDQVPGEPNFGPMAQQLEKNPITATAVKTDPATGLKVIDKDKALKVTMAGLADLQRQNDNIMMMLAPGGRRRR